MFPINVSYQCFLSMFPINVSYAADLFLSLYVCSLKGGVGGAYLLLLLFVVLQDSSLMKKIQIQKNQVRKTTTIKDSEDDDVSSFHVRMCRLWHSAGRHRVLAGHVRQRAAAQLRQGQGLRQEVRPEF